MNRKLVDRIANAVLYEGYILYPYRPSIKNRQRWTFGGLYPEGYCQTGNGEAFNNQTECLVQGSSATTVEIVVRFLHLIERRSDEQGVHSWQEAEEREVRLDCVTLGELASGPRSVDFAFPGGRRSEPLPGTAGELVREQQDIQGSVEVKASQVAEELFRVTVRVINRAPLEEGFRANRDAALLRTLVSAHSLLGVQNGAFVSLLDPPDCWREAAAACRNIGVWPVLVGVEGQTDAMLASPIILYDYPQIAPESPGDFFDGTEIDEMLTLRILTLTDDEKRAMAAVDERARGLLERTESLAREQMLRLHGTMRTAEESTHG
ncbi:MAG TPA: hypothetical protein VMG10_18640 [Gemmataceae bacterium]|nr:hypothetical protein [Gemmataceae bacterium]